MQGCAVVVGAGSIGLRHQQVLAALGMETVLVSRRAGQDLAVVQRGSDPTHVVIATAIHSHLSRRDVGWNARESSSRERVA